LKWIFISAPKGMETKKIQWICNQALKKGSIPIAPQLLFPQPSEDTIEKTKDAENELLGYFDELWAISNEDEAMRQQLKEAVKECLTVRYVADFNLLDPPNELPSISEEELSEIIDNATAVSCYLEDKIFVSRKVIEKVVFFQQLILRHFDEDEEVSLEETAKLITQADGTIPMDVVMLILRAKAEEVENALHQD